MDDLEQRVTAIIRNGAGAVLHQHERDAIARAIIPMVLEHAATVADAAMRVHASEVVRGRGPTPT